MGHPDEVIIREGARSSGQFPTVSGKPQSRHEITHTLADIHEVIRQARISRYYGKDSMSRTDFEYPSTLRDREIIYCALQEGGMPFAQHPLTNTVWLSQGQILRVIVLVSHLNLCSIE